ncbi:MAG: hypothetical protein ACE5ES_04815 [Candidatus Nanoarchaeia archaeon]
MVIKKELTLHYADGKYELWRGVDSHKKGFYTTEDRRTKNLPATIILESDDPTDIHIKLLEYLKQSQALENSYLFIPTVEAMDAGFDHRERRILEGILGLHNDLVTPRRN